MKNQSYALPLSPKQEKEKKKYCCKMPRVHLMQTIYSQKFHLLQDLAPNKIISCIITSHIQIASCACAKQASIRKHNPEQLRQITPPNGKNSFLHGQPIITYIQGLQLASNTTYEPKHYPEQSRQITLPNGKISFLHGQSIITYIQGTLLAS